MSKHQKNVLTGVALMIAMFFFWKWLIHIPPWDSARLLLWGKTVPGEIIDAGEEPSDTDYGSTKWYHYCIYAFETPGGKRTASTGDIPGRLATGLTFPVAIEVDYLPSNPGVSQIHGPNSDSVLDFLWRKCLLGFGLLALFLAPGAAIIRSSFRQRAYDNWVNTGMPKPTTPREIRRLRWMMTKDD